MFPFKRRIKAILLIIVVCIMFFESCDPGIVDPQEEGKELQITFHRQNTSVWCWAATIAMVVEYTKGTPIEDCQVLSLYDASLGGFGLCCQFPQGCIRGGQLWEMAYIMESLFGVVGEYWPSYLSFSQIQQNINNGYPMIASLSTGYSGHVVVLSGYASPDIVIVLDPIYGRYKVNYSTLLQNWQYGTWIATFIIYY